ncbi:hypothetical protein M430DRAFT_144441 [Amorphotheca resinae ATCC 22711]|uniref:DAGKc domain-containing protein n=1 Tax=Amorphotheca resinae ATCC 22711 TaxID=857342 RepID=A0A2T3AUI1_AMORE|nr:hypothetical protein M430DRAFT_144441 [Amorphotheca resinae ATCC 22711]PSS12292.1 hypothetical protein M430DRAFT_144441 [Amorphotheca resinae ATCC 22711]
MAALLSTSEASNAVYQDGQLTWSDGKLRDEDIIAVTSTDGSDIRHAVWSLAPTDTTTSPTQSPFELRATSATNLPANFLERYLLRALPDPLNPEGSDIHVLVSTLSGTGLALGFFEKVLQPLLRAIGLADSKYNVLRTKSAASVKEFAQSTLLVNANKGKKQTVLMLSGDGGIVDTINGLLENGNFSSTYVKPIVTQLPLGTGNALFHSLHRPSPLPSIYIQGLRTLFHGKPRPLPLFRASFSPGARALSNEGRTATPLQNDRLYGAVVASYGLHATLVADSDTTEYRAHGDKRFGLVATDLLFPQGGAGPHAYKADITLFKSGKGEVVDRKEHGYILASLVSNLEKTFTISPLSKPLDGQLRVVHFGAVSGEQAMGVMKEAYNNGNHISLDVVGYDSIEGLRIDFKEEDEDSKWRRCCIDGSIVSVEKNGWMEVRTVDQSEEPVEVLVDL